MHAYFLLILKNILGTKMHCVLLVCPIIKGQVASSALKAVKKERSSSELPSINFRRSKYVTSVLFWSPPKSEVMDMNWHVELPRIGTFLQWFSKLCNFQLEPFWQWAKPMSLCRAGRAPTPPHEWEDLSLFVVLLRFSSLSRFDTYLIWFLIVF